MFIVPLSERKLNYQICPLVDKIKTNKCLSKITKLKATVSYEGSTQTATVSITPYVVKSAYFATKE